MLVHDLISIRHDSETHSSAWQSVSATALLYPTSVEIHALFGDEIVAAFNNHMCEQAGYARKENVE
jgi:hypothetical protein